MRKYSVGGFQSHLLITEKLIKWVQLQCLKANVLKCTDSSFCPHGFFFFHPFHVLPGHCFFIHQPLAAVNAKGIQLHKMFSWTAWRHERLTWSYFFFFRDGSVITSRVARAVLFWNTLSSHCLLELLFCLLYSASVPFLFLPPVFIHILT